MPVESPGHGPRTLKSIRQHQHHPLAGTIPTVLQVPSTLSPKGNNVDAYEDGNNPDSQPDCGPTLSCDFPSI